MKHISLDKIILGLEKSDLEHIEICNQCKELYSLFNMKLDEEIINIIDSKVKEKTYLKFKEMKALGKFNKSPNQEMQVHSKSILKPLILANIAISLVVIISIIFAVKYFFSEQITEVSLGSNKVVIVSENKVKIPELKTYNKSLIIPLPSIKNCKILVPHSLEIEEIIITIGDIKYKILANKTDTTKIIVDNGKIIYENKIIDPIEPEKPQNILFLKNGEKIKGNLIEIKKETIIFKTEDKIIEVRKKDVEKIKYNSQ
ncbi:MAG: hypothetical protein ACK4F9_02695 [Brevinematia bacterium]